MIGGVDLGSYRLSKHTLEKASKAKLQLEAYYKRERVTRQRRANERFTLGPGCLAVDDATTICPMEKPKDLQRRSVLFQYTF